MAEYNSPPDEAFQKEAQYPNGTWLNYWVTEPDPDKWPEEMQKALKPYLIPELEPEYWEDNL